MNIQNNFGKLKIFFKVLDINLYHVGVDFPLLYINEVKDFQSLKENNYLILIFIIGLLSYFCNYSFYRRASPRANRKHSALLGQIRHRATQSGQVQLETICGLGGLESTSHLATGQTEQIPFQFAIEVIRLEKSRAERDHF